jgi:hypothetical protein
MQLFIRLPMLGGARPLAGSGCGKTHGQRGLRAPSGLSPKLNGNPIL